ncbi:MAG: hypothetical protein LBK53_03140 [Heliobacteriaceae bacterium]|jgi:hypothetical protein|nr:hypothetical protein [Heliobacteriaceae bacterium]
MKKTAALFILSVFMFNPCVAEVLHGGVEVDNQYRQMQNDLFTGEVQNLERRDVVTMTVSQVLDSALSLEGDEFFAEVTGEVSGKDGVIIPKGTIAHGRINQIKDSRKLGRPGWIELDFDYIITPDGREIPIDGKMSTKLHPVAETGRIIMQDVGYTAAGGVAGGFMALNWFGLEAAIASQGYTIAGGAAAGGIIGLGMALLRKGNDVLIAPGDEIRVKINTSVPLPVYKDTALMQHELFYPGLDIHISNVEHEKDPFGEVNTITLTIMISNMSDKIFSGLDMALVNDYNAVFRPSVFGDTKIMFKQIKPGDKIAGRISFSVDNINRKFWLTFYDKRNGKALSKISVDNAYRKVSDKTKKKNDRTRRKKIDYKKEIDVLDEK